MAKFAKIRPSFWRQKKLRRISCFSRLLAIYLMTNEHFRMVGIYRLPKYLMSSKTGLSSTEIESALVELTSREFCDYASDDEVIWIIDMAVSQVADNPNPKQLKGVLNELRSLADDEYPFIEDFLTLHGPKFGLPGSVETLFINSKSNMNECRDELLRKVHLKVSYRLYFINRVSIAYQYTIQTL